MNEEVCKSVKLVRLISFSRNFFPSSPGDRPCVLVRAKEQLRELQYFFLALKPSSVAAKTVNEGVLRVCDLSVGGISRDFPFLQSRGSGFAIVEVVTAEGSLHF